jgi:N4-gp56 family major capsid protein
MATTTTASPQFASTVTALIKAEIVALLRNGLPHLPREIMVICPYVKGTGDGTGDALFRLVNYLDIPANTADLVEGVTPAGKELTSDILEWKASQKGDFVKVSDVFAMQSPADIPKIMVERVTRQAAVTMDTLAKNTWQSAPGGETVLGSGTAGVKEADIRAAAAILSARGVPRVGGTLAGDGTPAGGAYVAIAHPFVIADLQAAPEWVETSKYASPDQLLTGEVGMYRGVRFIQSAFASVTGTGATSIYRTIVAGAQAMAWADPALLQTFLAGFTATESDPLAQRAAAGWKGWAGGTLNDLGGQFRHVVIQSNSTLSLQLPSTVTLMAGEQEAAPQTAKSSKA